MAAATKLSVLPPDFGLSFFGSEEVSERAKQKCYSFFVEGYVRRVELFEEEGSVSAGKPRTESNAFRTSFLCRAYHSAVHSNAVAKDDVFAGGGLKFHPSC
ncbi:hypothetical protein Bbelb_304290 [Branchiostoma belcheri]|nr:hypothetical protein Bbelb_304290 [Branchiostoma belcheri]